MKLKYKEFKKLYPKLHDYFCLLTKEAIEKANLSVYGVLAEACDYTAMIKLVYHQKESMLFNFVMKKRAAIALKARAGDKNAANITKKLIRAEEGINPFRGRRQKIEPEFNAIMREYAYIIMELQKLQPIKYSDENLFDKLDPDFLKAVKDIYKSAFMEEQLKLLEKKPEIKLKSEKEILKRVEEEIIACIKLVDPFQFAREILAKKYGVKDETIRKYLPATFKDNLKLKFPNISKSFAVKLIKDVTNEVLDQKIDDLYKKKEK